MFGATDWYGISAVIAAIGAAAATVIGALNHRTAMTTARRVSTNGDPRTAGEILTALAPPVAPAPPATDPPADTAPPPRG